MKKISKRKSFNVLKLGGKNLNIENWEVYHPNGTHMFTCGEKKVKWYLEKKLATITGDFKITLAFEPKGIGFQSNEIFGKSIRKNICVVSGVEHDLQRHHIVPACYRTFFPSEFKSKNHHDVVLINHLLHSEYERVATKFKDEIAKIYKIKTISEYNTEYIAKLRESGSVDVMVLSNLLSLFKTHGKVSDAVRFSKIKQISIGTGIPIETVSGYNYIQLYKLYLLISEKHYNDVENFKNNERKYYDHGYHLIKKLDTEKKIIEFVKLWRNHFIETMKPEFMPLGWSIDFRIKTIV